MRADLLDLSQDLDLPELRGIVIEYPLGLGQLVHRGELLVLRGVAVELQNLDSGILNLLDVLVDRLDVALGYVVGCLLFPLLVETLGREVGQLGCHRVFTQFSEGLSRGVHNWGFIHVERMWVVDRGFVPENRILLHPRLPLHSLHCSLLAHILIEINMSLISRCPNHNLVQHFTPLDVGYRVLPHHHLLLDVKVLAVHEQDAGLFLILQLAHGCPNQEESSIWAQAHFRSRMVVREMELLDNRSFELPDVPDFEGAIHIPGIDIVPLGKDFGVLFVGSMSISHEHLWSVNVLGSAEDLQRTINASPHNHFPIIQITHSSHPSHQVLCVQTSEQCFVSQFLLYPFQFLFEIPESYAPIPRACYELVVVLRMEHSIVDSVGVAFCFMEIVDVHVPLYGQKALCSVFVSQHDLLPPAHNQHMGARRVVMKRPDGVAFDGFCDSETIHALAHPVEIPHSHSVVQGPSHHSITLWVNIDCSHRVLVSFERRE